MKYPEISIEQLNLLIKEDSHTIIDIRPIAAYNGWRLENEPRASVKYQNHTRGVS